MSSFNQGETEKLDTVDPVWWHGWMPRVHRSEPPGVCRRLRLARAANKKKNDNKIVNKE